MSHVKFKQRFETMNNLCVLFVFIIFSICGKTNLTWRQDTKIVRTYTLKVTSTKANTYGVGVVRLGMTSFLGGSGRRASTTRQIRTKIKISYRLLLITFV